MQFGILPTSDFQFGITFKGRQGVMSVEFLVRGTDTTPISQLTPTPGSNMKVSTRTARTNSEMGYVSNISLAQNPDALISISENLKPLNGID